VPFRFAERFGKFSPDGRWVAYSSNESGRFEIYVTPFPGPGPNILISTAGGEWPRWRHDGRELFYVAPDSMLMAAEVNGEGSHFTISAVRPLFQMHPGGIPYQYDVSRDGQRILVSTLVERAMPAPTPIMVVANWTALPKK
jgi:WD40 repeat protein